jgi:hypothetical protein
LFSILSCCAVYVKSKEEKLNIGEEKNVKNKKTKPRKEKSAPKK